MIHHKDKGGLEIRQIISISMKLEDRPVVDIVQTFCSTGALQGTHRSLFVASYCLIIIK